MSNRLLHSGSSRLRWLRVTVLLTATLLLSLATLGLWATRPHLFPRLDLPEFDAGSPARLSPAQRSAYEHELFSELSVWNTVSQRYPDVHQIPHRSQRWREMAQEGFELAHITLRVLAPQGGWIYRLSGPMQRLDELARAGDTGAMCLMVGLVTAASRSHDVEPYRSTYRTWLQRGAELGHPECLGHLGGRLLLGTDGFSKDARRGLDMEFAARRMGYVHDTGALIRHYESAGHSDLSNVRRHYCWLSVEAQTRVMVSPEVFLIKLDELAQSTGRNDLRVLHQELRASKYTVSAL